MSQAAQTKPEYLSALEAELRGLEPGEIAEILRDTSEHFDHALASGKTEAEAAHQLGEPRVLAAGYLAQGLLRATPAKSASFSKGSVILFRALKALFIVAPLNFVFAFGPFVVLSAVLVAGWIVGGALSLASVAGLLAFIASGGLTSSGVWVGLSIFFLGIGVVGCGVLSVLIMLKLTEVGFRAVWSWVRWNIDFLKAH